MEQPRYIYVLSDPESGAVRYVGKTDSLRRRYGAHLSAAAKGAQTPSAEWIRDLLSRGLKPKFKVIETITVEDWEERETFWIAHFRALGDGLTNVAFGGIGGRRLPEERWAMHFDACVSCGRTDRIHAGDGLCGACYNRQWHRNQKQPDRPYYEWSWDYPACVDCGTTERPHKGRGRCQACLRRWKRSQQPPAPPRWALHYERCTQCGTTDRRHQGHGLCALCHQRATNGTADLLPPGSWSKRHARCVACGTTEFEHQAKGLCSRCNARQWREQRSQSV